MRLISHYRTLKLANGGLVIFILLWGHVSAAQKTSGLDGHHPRKNLYVVFEGQRLRSTHSQTIYGFSVGLFQRLNSSFSAGFGCEISYSDSLHTHNRYLTVLSFKSIPIYLETRYSLASNSRIVPYADLAIGISAISYARLRHDPSTGNIEHKNVYQNGLFFRTGVGVLFKLNDRVASSLKASFKGFHFSRNPYEINPHGVTLSLGIVVKIAGV